MNADNSLSPIFDKIAQDVNFFYSNAHFSFLNYFLICIVIDVIGFPLYKESDISRRRERFACVANERASSSCINPNLSTPGTSPDGAAASFYVGSYFCLSPRVLSDGGCLQFANAVRWRDGRSKRVKEPALSYLPNLPRSPAGCAAPYKREIVSLAPSLFRPSTPSDQLLQRCLMNSHGIAKFKRSRATHGAERNDDDLLLHILVLFMFIKET